MSGFELYYGVTCGVVVSWQISAVEFFSHIMPVCGDFLITLYFVKANIYMIFNVININTIFGSIVNICYYLSVMAFM